MVLRHSPYTIELKRRFTLSSGSRTTTPAVIVELEQDGIVGYGEGAMPPYLGESPQSSEAFFAKVDMSKYRDPSLRDEILDDIDRIAPGNNAAKAAIDIALHDWIGKAMVQPWHRIWGIDPGKTPLTSFTIGMDAPEAIRQVVADADGYQILKVKLGGENDQEIITTIRQCTDKPLRVDVNQGWKDARQALSLCEWLADRNVELVEQPLPVQRGEEMAWLRSHSPIPIIADESVLRLEDVKRCVGVFDGINVKLMKSTGMREAYSMIMLARSLGLKIMLGCMTETSCAISAAAQLSPLVDWADLDGAALIKNDPFVGATIVDGRIVMPKGNGIGVTRISS
ncbi:MAG TPA: dipeptide epimerase [Bacteroidota bacterium]|nr:dipeptide epimerase [Bacteroidota bacterium]